MARVVTYIVNISAFVFMIPFALMEYWTIIEQGWRWIQPRNVLDICAIVFQIFIFVCHMLHWQVHKEWFSTVLAFQCVFLFAKLQNFGRYALLVSLLLTNNLCVLRVLGTGASISEIFISVIYDVRYLLVYIFFTGISASLCLGAIYKHDDVESHPSISSFNNNTLCYLQKILKYEGKDLGLDEHFKSFQNLFVTTFQIIFGSFDSNYIFKAEHPWIKIIFFFGFQVLMTITVLNLLIAVMTESYSKVRNPVHMRHHENVSRSLQRNNAFVTIVVEQVSSTNWTFLECLPFSPANLNPTFTS